MRQGRRKRVKVTIADVAKTAGVSVASVSYVLNRRGKLSQATEQHIRAVMAQLSYEPRRHVVREQNRSRVTREANGRIFPHKSGLVVLLVSDTRIAAAQTTQVGIITAAASEWLSDYGHEMILAAIPADGGAPLCLGDKRLRGVLLRGAGALSVSQIKALQKIPCVEFFGGDDPVKWDQVVIDDQGIGRIAFELLRKKGCDHFIAYSPDSMHYAFHTRIGAFRFHAVEEGFPVEVIESRNDEPLPVDMMAQHSKERLGIFMAGHNGKNSIRFMDERLHLAGLDEEHGVRRIGVSLTGEIPHDMVVISLEQLGQMCAQQLVWRMQHPMVEARRILIQPAIREAPTESLPEAAGRSYYP